MVRTQTQNPVWRVRVFAVAALVCALLRPGLLRAQSGEPLEAQVKSAFLLNFARYVEWPANTFSNANSPIIIGVLGPDSLGRALDATIEGHTVEKHPVEIARSRRLSELIHCHVLFIAAPERERVRDELAQLKGKSILTVSDMEGFTDSGGMIRLKKVRGLMRFDINRSPAEASGLKISSKLLKLADHLQ